MLSRTWCRRPAISVDASPFKDQKNFVDTAVWLSLHLSRKAVAEYLRISWDTVGPIILRVEKELSENNHPLDILENIGIDETSYQKRHKYITVIVNYDTNTVVWAAKGHGWSVLEPFFKQLDTEQRSKIRLVSGDGARWIKDTVEEYCPMRNSASTRFMWYRGVPRFWMGYAVRNGTKHVRSLQKKRRKNPDAADQRVAENKSLQLNSASRLSSHPSILR